MWYCWAKWLTKLCPSGWDRYYVSCSFVLGPRHFRKKYIWIDSWQMVRTFLIFNDALVSSTLALPVNIFTWKKEKPCSPGQRKFLCAGNVKKAVSLISKTTTLHVHLAFLHFFSVPAQLQREMTKFWVDLRTGNGKAINCTISPAEFARGPPSSVPN